MDPYTLDHLSDRALFRGLNAVVSRDRVSLALLLAHLAEFDARRLYAPAGYSSMFAYCVEALHFSEPEAGRRIHAARTARRFPILYPALASGRIHLTAIGLLAPYLTEANVSELAEAAAHRSKYAIETLLARRFPDALPKVKATVMIRAVSPPSSASSATDPPPLFTFDVHRSDEPSSLPTDPSLDSGLNTSSVIDAPSPPGVPMRHKEHLPGDVELQADGARSAAEDPSMPPSLPVSPPPPRPAAPEHFLIRVTIPRGTHDKLREAQALLSHAVRVEDVAEVLDRALDALIALLKRRRIGSSSHAISNARVSVPNPVDACPDPKRGRSFPTAIRRAVWERDEGRCTFVSADGHRCGERQFLQFDHAEPVARGGSATVDTIRLRCHAHNQYEAERAFGAAFMNRTRPQAARDH